MASFRGELGGWAGQGLGGNGRIESDVYLLVLESLLVLSHPGLMGKHVLLMELCHSQRLEIEQGQPALRASSRRAISPSLRCSQTST